MKIEITLQSFMLTGSGEGSALIDTDVVFHKMGFPFIPARRVKGMLKESLMEILEIENKTYDSVDLLFGKNDQTGKLVLSNFYLKNWKEIKKEIRDEIEKLKDKSKFVLQPDDIKKFFTTEIQQTAINIESGIAKNTSLRNYRVINPFIDETPVCFEAEINGDLAGDEIKLLSKAMKNLRYAGLRRNRGFGKIRCELIIEEKNEKEKNEIKKDENAALENNGNKNKLVAAGEELYVTLATLSPVALTMQLGEKNTVFTEMVINGNRLRGLLANLYIKNKLSGNTDAHTDPDFRKIFLSGNVTFETLYKDGSGSIPLHIHRFKGDDKRYPIDIFTWENSDNSITKPVGGFGTYKENKPEKNEPETTFFFHNSRPDRTAGRSKKDQIEGGIFYYEALGEDQLFTGKIKGNNYLLKKLGDAIGKTNIIHIGRSRSAQYGEIELILANPPQVDINSSNVYEKNESAGSEPVASASFLLILQTPLILLNNCGGPEANGQNLVRCLKSLWSDAEGNKPAIEIEKSAAAFTFIEQYNSVWQSKSGKLPAYKEGSSFVVEFKNLTAELNEKLDKPNEIVIGEWTEQGFGKIKIQPFHANNTPVEAEISDEETGVKKTEDNNQANTKPPEEAIPKNETLQKIYWHIKRDDEEVKANTRAIEDAKKYHSLSNHLISRLERMVGGYETKDKMETWVKNIKGKPAWKALKEVKIINEKDEFDFNKLNLEDYKKHKQQAGTDLGLNDEIFKLNKTYWLSLFRAVRKFKKHNQENENK